MQQQAMLGVFVIASPLLTLLGCAAPIENMPVVVECLTRADPTRYMMVIARGLFLQDMSSALAMALAWPMALMAVATLSPAGVAVRRVAELAARGQSTSPAMAFHTQTPGRNCRVGIPVSATTTFGVSVRGQPDDIHADRGLQRRPGERAGDFAATGALAGKEVASVILS